MYCSLRGALIRGRMGRVASRRPSASGRGVVAASWVSRSERVKSTFGRQTVELFPPPFFPSRFRETVELEKRDRKVELGETEKSSTPFSKPDFGLASTRTGDP